MIPDELVEEVKALRLITDKRGRNTPLKKISIQTKLSIREVKYILYERDKKEEKDIRIQELIEQRKTILMVERARSPNFVGRSPNFR